MCYFTLRGVMWTLFWVFLAWFVISHPDIAAADVRKIGHVILYSIGRIFLFLQDVLP